MQHRNQRGQTAVMFTIAIIPLLGMVGLVVDMGWAYFRKQAAQTAADAAAIDLAAMDKVGVDGAIFISAFSLYGYDSSYAVEVQRAHPGRMSRSSGGTHPCFARARNQRALGCLVRARARARAGNGRSRGDGVR